MVYNVIALGGHLSTGTFEEYWRPLQQPDYLVAVLYLGTGSAFGANALNNFALSRIVASRMTVFGNLSIVVTVAAGALFLGERIYWYNIQGAVVIVGGL